MFLWDKICKIKVQNWSSWISYSVQSHSQTVLIPRTSLGSPPLDGCYYFSISEMIILCLQKENKTLLTIVVLNPHPWNSENKPTPRLKKGAQAPLRSINPHFVLPKTIAEIQWWQVKESAEKSWFPPCQDASWSVCALQRLWPRFTWEKIPIKRLILALCLWIQEDVSPYVYCLPSQDIILRHSCLASWNVWNGGNPRHQALRVACLSQWQYEREKRGCPTSLHFPFQPMFLAPQSALTVWTLVM